ncbi:hypothetical protein NW762_004303 [Fusarium torreyae]|uniref:DUF7820 domain-containing protein n=1 Tax=Fusarium torreyae TaxID=1237075 RepID=A0A9W8S6J5_9HYPO|nr:hypothetical protein NW762_004303 [Fusarium torreyae]
MDSNNGKDSSFSRHSSTRRSRSLRLSAGSGVTDDGYDLSAMMVADGFRPTDNAAPSSSTNPSSNSNTQPEPSLSSAESFSQPTASTKSSQPAARVSSEFTPAIRNRPSSISKPHRNHDSLALRNDGTPAADRSHVRNNPSLSSDSPIIRAESPYTGPSGPSHPYQMYPQRTMSVATTSTAANAVVPEDRSYGGPRGPTHPYALYTQNTTSGETSNPSIPVGFNGLGGSYQRQIGPDGEEAGDMIGPLGHLEELPPYTRYPDNSYVPKPTTQTPPSPVSPVSPVSPASPVAEPSSPAPSRSIPGAGGIGMATRDPEFSSTDDDLALPRTRPSVRSNVSETSQHDINTAAAEVSEKPTVNKWQRRAKKKLWGIVPYWAICLLIVGLVLMGIIMGAVIGTMLSRNHKPPPPDHDDKYSSSPPTTTTYEPEVLTAIPTDLPPVATGRFSFPNIDPSQTASSCFNDSQQEAAWSCDIIFPFYSIEIKDYSTPKSKTDVDYKLKIQPINNDKVKFPWDTRPPIIVDPVSLTLVNDTADSTRGIAWWLKTTYNKTVVVSDQAFTGKGKRGWDPDGKEDYEEYNAFHRFKNKMVNVQVGQQPWVCTWPNTIIEIFIYPSENATISPYTRPSTTSTPPDKPTSTDPYTIPTGTGSVFDVQFAPYPRVFKILERRVWDEDSIATCTQCEVVGNGTVCDPLTDDDGNVVTVTIVEDEEDSTSSFSERSDVGTKKFSRDLFQRAATPGLSDCGCLWRST